MTHRIRILFVDPVPRIGGAEGSLLEMAAGLDRSRFEVLAAVPSGELDAAVRERGVPTVNLPFRRFKRGLASGPASLAALCRAVPALVRLAREEKIHVIHANGNQAQIYAAPAARRARRPCVWHSRDLAPLGAAGKWMARGATRIIAISNAVRDHLQPYVTEPGKLMTLYNGIAVEPFRAADTTDRLQHEFGFPEESVVIAMAGQMVPWKNHPLFLRAAARVSRAAPEARFLVIGDDRFGDHPGYRRRLEALAAEDGLAGRLVFTGYRTDMARILAGIHVLVHPASREPFGRVVVEAMAAGKPVVAVHRCGPAEIVRNGIDGILVPPDQTEAMADAVLELVADRDRARRMGRSGRERAAQAFSLRDFLPRVESLYAEILAATRSDW